jgi:hypothetical protein
MPRFNIREVGQATRFNKENPRPGRARPKTKMVREYSRMIAMERDPKTKRIIAEELARTLVKFALSIGLESTCHACLSLTLVLDDDRLTT